MLRFEEWTIIGMLRHFVSFWLPRAKDQRHAHRARKWQSVPTRKIHNQTIELQKVKLVSSLGSRCRDKRLYLFIYKVTYLPSITKHNGVFSSFAAFVLEPSFPFHYAPRPCRGPVGHSCQCSTIC
jgi:hypothetical protein